MPIVLASCRSAGTGVEAPLLEEAAKPQEAGPQPAKGSPPKPTADDLVGPVHNATSNSYLCGFQLVMWQPHKSAHLSFCVYPSLHMRWSSI